MRTHDINGYTARRVARALLVGGLVAAVACGDILEVKNTNAIDESALGNPAAAPNMANGSLAATTRMLSATTVPYGVATDELDWIGSRDSWGELERGVLTNINNEFTDGAFPWVGEARYVADNTIKILSNFNTLGTLANRADLARSYIYAAVVYASIADMFDDFAISDKTTSKAPLGRANMSRMYDTAIVYLDRANALATATGANTALQALRYPILAYRARVKHAKAVWDVVTPVTATRPASPLVNDPGANADANAAIALGTTDEKFTLRNNLEATATINIWFEVNGRAEHRTGTFYRTLNDPVTGAADPTIVANLAAFTAFGSQAGTFTITSTRELRLILAEAALAQGVAGQAAFLTQINAVRALDGKPAYVAGTPAQDQAMLVHERTVQLWLMNRRLMDMYRFAGAATWIKDPKWVDATGFLSANSTNGLLFPIPIIEVRSNECMSSTPPAGC
jgi:hypothetical protein